jgi:hypothetical protein
MYGRYGPVTTGSHVGEKMTKRRGSGATAMAVPLMMAELTMSSWETIWRRSAMITNGSCTWAEYQRMVIEKVGAAQGSALAMMHNASVAATLSPWHRQAKANAKRLRRNR